MCKKHKVTEFYTYPPRPSNILDKYFKNAKFNELIKPALVTSYNLTLQCAAIFKSSSGSMAEKLEYNISSIVNASTAAPTYFPPISIENELYIDGGVCANNPSVALLSYAISSGYKLKDIKILSLGTGKYLSKLKGNPKDYSSISWLRNGLIDDLFAGSSSVNDYNLNLILNEEIEKRNIKTDEKMNSDEISNIVFNHMVV